MRHLAAQQTPDFSCYTWNSTPRLCKQLINSCVLNTRLTKLSEETEKHNCKQSSLKTYTHKYTANAKGGTIAQLH